MEIVASLNRYFEIIGLLYTYSHPDLDDKEVWNKAAKEYHISADELSRKMGSLPKKYFSAFQKAASVSNQEDFNFFFSDEDDAFGGPGGIYSGAYAHGGRCDGSGRCADTGMLYASDGEEEVYAGGGKICGGVLLLRGSRAGGAVEAEGAGLYCAGD